MTSHRVFKQGRGRVVIFSVHQPSPRAFRAIDRVMLLGPGGKRLWCGAPRDAEGFFTAAGLPCPEENLFNLGASSSTPEPSGPDAGLHADALVASLTLPDRGYRVDVSEWMLEVASCPARVAALAAARVDCAEPPRTSAPSSPSSTPPVPHPDAHSTVGIAVSAPLVDHRDARAPRARGQDGGPGSDPPRRAPLSRPRHRRGARVALPKLPKIPRRVPEPSRRHVLHVGVLRARVVIRRGQARGGERGAREGDPVRVPRRGSVSFLFILVWAI